MNDPALVRRVERLGDLSGDAERLFNREHASPDGRELVRQRWAVHELEHECVRGASVLETVDPANVWTVEPTRAPVPRA